MASSSNFTTGNLALLNSINAYLEQIQEIPNREREDPTLSEEKKALEFAQAKIADMARFFKSEVIKDAREPLEGTLKELMALAQAIKDKQFSNCPGILNRIKENWKKALETMKAPALTSKLRVVKVKSPEGNTAVMLLNERARIEKQKLGKQSLLSSQEDEKVRESTSVLDPTNIDRKLIPIYLRIDAILREIIAARNEKKPNIVALIFQLHNQYLELKTKAKVAIGNDPIVKPFAVRVFNYIDDFIKSGELQVPFELSNLSIFSFIGKNIIQNCFHGVISAEHAEEILRSAAKPCYLFRIDEEDGDFIISSIFDDNVEHHILGETTTSESISVEGVSYRSFEEYIEKNLKGYDQATSTLPTCTRIKALIRQATTEMATGAPISDELHSEFQRIFEILQSNFHEDDKHSKALCDHIVDEIYSRISPEEGSEVASEAEILADLDRLSLLSFLYPETIKRLSSRMLTSEEAEKRLGEKSHLPSYLFRRNEDGNLVITSMNKNKQALHHVIKDLDKDVGMRVSIEGRLEYFTTLGEYLSTYVNVIRPHVTDVDTGKQKETSKAKGSVEDSSIDEDTDIEMSKGKHSSKKQSEEEGEIKEKGEARPKKVQKKRK